MTPQKFRVLVWRFYKKEGRHDLPWRKTHDLYHTLVSEVMLQQTQVDRVIPFYTNFIKKFPTASKLAAAPLSDVLKAWQGLGYNRRAKMLHQVAKQLSDIQNLSYRTKHEDTSTEIVKELEKLPGVGPYTARAVAAFVYNQDVIVIETNIRTAVIHHFFVAPVASISLPRSARAARPIQHLGKNMLATGVSDAEIEEVLAQALPKGRAREWYSALMDYGAHLKRSGVSHNARTKGYAKQSKFTGSLREARGAILRELAKSAKPKARLLGLLGDDRESQLREALDALIAEGFVAKRGRSLILAT